MKRIFPLLILLSTIFGCVDDGPGSEEVYDRTDLLTNWADNLIIPAYENFDAKLGALQLAGTNFTSDPTTSTLATLRAAWKEAYVAWQYVSMFGIGQAETSNFRNFMNIYPANTTEIDQNISSGTYDLTLPSMFDAQGFPALDYLLHGLAATDGDILAFYSTDANAEKYKFYLNDLLARMVNLTSLIVNDWKTSYRDIFVANTESSANGAVDKLVNDFLFYYEKSLRAGKIGIPAGNFSSNPLPENVEAFYKKDISKELLLAAIDASINFFEGKHFNSTTKGESLVSYLDFLNAQANGSSLSTQISDQFVAARTKANSLNDNFVTQIDTNNTLMLETFDELQKNVVLLKVDMLSALSINVDFVDADGD